MAPNATLSGSDNPGTGCFVRVRNCILFIGARHDPATAPRGATGVLGGRDDA